MRISDWSSDVCSSDLVARRKLIEAKGKAIGCRIDGGGFTRSKVGDINAERRRAVHAAHLARLGPGGRSVRGSRCDDDDQASGQDRKSVVSGERVSVRVDLGGGRIIKKNNKRNS